jgi:hypothetical protein
MNIIAFPIVYPKVAAVVFQPVPSPRKPSCVDVLRSMTSSSYSSHDDLYSRVIATLLLGDRFTINRKQRHTVVYK